MKVTIEISELLRMKKVSKELAEEAIQQVTERINFQWITEIVRIARLLQTRLHLFQAPF